MVIQGHEPGDQVYVIANAAGETLEAIKALGYGPISLQLKRYGTLRQRHLYVSMTRAILADQILRPLARQAPRA